MKKLRNYQTEIVEKAKAALQTEDRVVIVSPTGSGKTHIAAYGIVPILPKPILWVTHRIELAEQAQSYSMDYDVVMASVANPEGYNSIIIDEGHHSCAVTYARIINQTKEGVKVIGLTATPYRLDGRGLGEVGFGCIITGRDVYDLTNDGYLCPCEVFIPESELHLSWNPKAVANVLKNRKFKAGIIYSRRVCDAYATAMELTSIGIKASALSADTLPEERAGIIHQFKKGIIKVICNHTILTEGTDLPHVDLIVLNRPTKSRALWRQMIGRGLRNSKGKEFCTVLDLAANSKIHGSIYDKEVYDIMGRVIATTERFIERVNTDKDEQEYNYNAGEELKQWKPLPELKIMRRTLLNLNARLLKRRLLTGTSDT